MRRLLIPSALALLLSLPGPLLLAQEGERVISFDGLHPSIALQASGGFVLVWDDSDHVGDYFSLGIFGQMYDAHGAPTGRPFRVSQSPGYQTFPRVAADALGNFVVVYSEVPDFPSQLGGDGDASGLFAQRFDAGGTPEGRRFRVNEAIEGDQNFPAMAMEPGGAFVVAWYGYERTNSGVRIARFSADGVRLGRDLHINREGERLYNEPRVAIDAGGLNVGWTELAFCPEQPTPLAVERIPMIAHFEPNGQPFIEFFRLKDGACDGTGWILGDLAGAPVGSVALFQGLRSSVQRFTPAGETAGRRLVISSPALCQPNACDELPLAMAVNRSGRFAVVWDVRRGEGRHDLMAQRFDEQGRPLGERFQVNKRPSTDWQMATAALDDDGTLVVAWRRYGFPHNKGGLILRRFPG